jgi:hypothetical protein
LHIFANIKAINRYDTHHLVWVDSYQLILGYPSPWHHGIMVAETAWWPHQVRRAFRSLPVERCGCATIQVAHPGWDFIPNG